MEIKPLTVAEIVSQVYGTSADFRAFVCDRTLTAFAEGRPIPDTWIFYLNAVRLHAANVSPENARHHLDQFAALIKCGNSNGHKD